MIISNNIKYIKGNKYIDPSGNVLTLTDVTDKGKVFTTKDNSRMALTEKQVNNLKLLVEDIYSINYKEFKVIGINFKFDGCAASFPVNCNALKSIKVFNSFSGDNRVIGNIIFNISYVTLGEFTLDFLTSYNNTGTIRIMLQSLNSDIYKADFISRIYPIDSDGNYACIFEGTKLISCC